MSALAEMICVGLTMSISLEARTRELEQRASENLKFSAEMSYVVNDIQLRQQGLSPLQKRFNVVLGAKLGKRS